MSECTPSAPNNKGAIQYTHLFLCISSGRRLTNFSMRSLYFQIHLHPSLCPLISHSVWCHRPDVHFNAAFYVELSKLEPLTINDLSISFDLYSRQLQSSSHLGIAKLPLNQKETLQKGKKPITYFYHQDPVDLIDPYTPTPVGNIFVTIALGYEDQINLIEPQTRFIQVQITPIDKKNTKYSSPSLWMKTAHKHGWMSIEEIEENWMELAQSNGWIPFQKNDNLTLETFKPINILKEYEAPPTADLLTIQPELDSNPLLKEPEIVKHELFPPEEVVQISPQPKIEFNNKIKKPITVMDFFPRLSYSNKYESSEKSDSEWDILIGKYLKASSSTLKSFPKQKRTKSASYNKRLFSKSSFNNIQNSNKKEKNSKTSNIEISSSQYLDTNKANNFISQSESSELDSSNNFMVMLNNEQNKNDQNKFKNSKKSNSSKKYNLDDDEKEWSSDFFSDSPDAASNQLDVDMDAPNQKNNKTENKPFNLSLEEIVEKEMEKLSKNSIKNDQNITNKTDSNEPIQSNQNSDSSQKVESEVPVSKKNKTVFFSPPPSLTQVIQKIEKNHNQNNDNSTNSIDQINSQIENVNTPEEEINENNNIDIETNNNKEDAITDQDMQPYSDLNDQQQVKKSRKRKHRTKNIQQATEPNQENNQLQTFQENENQSEIFENNFKNENISNFPEKTTIKRRKLKSPSPPKRLRKLKKRDQQNESQDEVKTYSSFDPNIENQDQINYDNLSEFASQNLYKTAPINFDHEIIEPNYSLHEDTRRDLTSPPYQTIQPNQQEASFSVPSHRRHHNDDDPIQPYQPIFQEDIEQFNENYQKVKTDQIDSQKNSNKKRRPDQYKEHIHHKKRHHQEQDQEFSVENSQKVENDENTTFSEIQNTKQRFSQTEEDEEEQPTSPKIQLDQEESHEAPLSTPHHKHRHRNREEDDQIQFKTYEEERQSLFNSMQQEEAELFAAQEEQQAEQQEEQQQTKRKRTSQHHNRKINNDPYDEESIQKVADFGQLLTNNNEQAASSSAPSSVSSSQSPQGQQITVYSSSSSIPQRQNRRQKQPDQTSPDYDYNQSSFSEKVAHRTKIKLHTQNSPSGSPNSPEDQPQPKPKPSSLSKSNRKRFLPSPDDFLNGRELTIAEKFSPDNSKTMSGGSFRSFIPTNQSLAESKRSIPKRKIGHNSSSLLNRTLPASVVPYKPSGSFIESVSTESSLKKRKKRHNLARSNSPKPPPKEETFLGAEDFFDGSNAGPATFSKTFAVHSPTNKANPSSKLEGEFSPQLIDFSSQSPSSSPTRIAHKKRTPNSPLKNLNDNQNLNRNEIKDSKETDHSFKKSKNLSKYYKVSNESQENGENVAVEVKYKKNGSAKKSPTKREKKVPKKPMDIKTAASFGPGPLSPATPSAQKKGIRMSPSLERMINGIDKLENSLDISGIESDYED